MAWNPFKSLTMSLAITVKLDEETMSLLRYQNAYLELITKEVYSMSEALNTALDGLKTEVATLNNNFQAVAVKFNELLSAPSEDPAAPAAIAEVAAQIQAVSAGLAGLAAVTK